MTAFQPSLTQKYALPAQGSWPAAEHQFNEKTVWALQAALAGRRPLLVRGEPGIGKSQLARAAAAVLEVPFLVHVVDERSERDDLLYHYDAVARLARAQVSALSAAAGQDWEAALAERNFFRPGVLWWAFDWDSARVQADRFATVCRACPEPTVPAGWSPGQKVIAGPVVLIDEIDKADPSVPNGLLESLGNDGFETHQLGEPIRLREGAPRPLVIITTNEERELPAAFLRRCLVLQLEFPKTEEEALAFLCARARVCWPDEIRIGDNVLTAAGKALWRDRRQATPDSGMAVPGASEFLDLVRVLAELRPGNEMAQLAALEMVEGFALRKNRAEG